MTVLAGIVLFVVGAWTGFLLAALLVVARDSDEALTRPFGLYDYPED